VPVFMSDRVESVRVEIQIRTVAMDFWASVEHKIYYKYDGIVPETLLTELKEAADAVTRLDMKMERLYGEVAKLADTGTAVDSEPRIAWRTPTPDAFLSEFFRPNDEEPTPS
jgi:putative GTP pyrophosphokinase